ncbi:transposase [Streptomyces cyaneofuscatus]
MITFMGRGDLTDEQWAVPELLSVKGARAGRPSVWPRRQLIDGIRFRVLIDVPWRDVSAELSPPIVIYRPSPTGGRRVTIRCQIAGLAHDDGDVIEYLRRAGFPDAADLLDQSD